MGSKIGLAWNNVVIISKRSSMKQLDVVNGCVLSHENAEYISSLCVFLCVCLYIFNLIAYAVLSC